MRLLLIIALATKVYLLSMYYMYIYVYISIYIGIYINIYSYIYIHQYIYQYIYISISTNISLSLSLSGPIPGSCIYIKYYKANFGNKEYWIRSSKEVDHDVIAIEGKTKMTMWFCKTWKHELFPPLHSLFQKCLRVTSIRFLHPWVGINL